MDNCQYYCMSLPWTDFNIRISPNDRAKTDLPTVCYTSKHMLASKTFGYLLKLYHKNIC